MKKPWFLFLVLALVLLNGLLVFLLYRKLPLLVAPQVEESPPQYLTLAFTGDLMVHERQLKAAHQGVGVYDFSKSFAEIAPWLQLADYTFGNLETTLGDGPYETYPRFQAPIAFASSLKTAGFDGLFLANNHSFDFGLSGIRQNIRMVDSLELDGFGTSVHPPGTALQFLELKGFKVGVLAYTERSNQAVPPSQDFSLQKLDSAQLVQDLARAKAQGADLRLIHVHFGEEYQREPNAYQQRVANWGLAGGANAVIGTHPHVLQPLSKVPMTNGSDTSVVAYSLGNFISDQLGRYKSAGAILYLCWKKEKGSTRLVGVRVLPTFTQIREGIHEVIPFRPHQSYPPERMQQLRDAQELWGKDILLLEAEPILRGW